MRRYYDVKDCVDVPENIIRDRYLSLYRNVGKGYLEFLKENYLLTNRQPISTTPVYYDVESDTRVHEVVIMERYGRLRKNPWFSKSYSEFLREGYLHVDMLPIM